MTTVKKAVQANYSEDIILSLVSDYNAAYDANPDNAIILVDLSAKYGKTVHSIRAKLASLKVYKTAQAQAQGTVGIQKATKEQIVDTLSRVCQLDMEGLEVAPKKVLQDLLVFVMTQSKRIDELESNESSE